MRARTIIATENARDLAIGETQIIEAMKSELFH